MAYYFYLGNVLLPVPPKKLELKISNKNKTQGIYYKQVITSFLFCPNLRQNKQTKKYF